MIDNTGLMQQVMSKAWYDVTGHMQHTSTSNALLFTFEQSVVCIYVP